MEIQRIYIVLLCAVIGIIVCIVLDRKLKWKEKQMKSFMDPWFILFFDYVFVSGVTAFFLYTIFHFSVPKIMIIDDEKDNSVYFAFFEKDKYIIELKATEAYVLNKMDRRICIYTVVKDSRDNEVDYLVLRPMDIGVVNRWPKEFFPPKDKHTWKVPWSPSRNHTLNVVEYY